MFSARSIFIVIFSLLAAPLISPRNATNAAELACTQEQTAQLQSASGRIASVQGNTFTLEPQKSQSSNREQAQQEKALTFTIDQSTTVEGKIEVGANADVTYRQQAGNNIAVSVRVSPPQ
jgi:hypothetical protein